MTEFVGRAADLATLAKHLANVERTGRGRMLALRGRRQVGKSTLVEHFCNRSGLAHVFFVAARRQNPAAAIADFSAELANSQLPGAAAAREGALTSWVQALDVATAGAEHPVIVVLDELPWLVESDPALEGLLQRVWDRTLSRRPVLLVLIGSDLAMMDALTAHGRPLFDRATVIPVDPLHPADVATLARLDPAAAIDAWSITGGFPNLVRAWPAGGTAPDYIREQLGDPTSPLIVAGERKIAAEFAPDAQARLVLDAIGTGNREHGKVSNRTGLGSSSLDRALEILLAKRVVGKDIPYSTAATRLTHYRVLDAHLRFWLRYVGPNLPAIERGASRAVTERVLRDWQAWRGEAVEPIIRESVARLCVADEMLHETQHVGRWWRRDGSGEVDLVAGDRQPVAQRVLAVGSIKWRESAPFDDRDARELTQTAASVPGGAGAALVAVSRSTFARDGLDRAWQPADLVAAW